MAKVIKWILGGYVLSGIVIGIGMAFSSGSHAESSWFLLLMSWCVGGAFLFVAGVFAAMVAGAIAILGSKQK